MKENSNALTIRLSDKHYKYLINTSKEMNISMNSIIISLIEDKMEKYSSLNLIVRDILEERINEVLKKRGF